VSLHPRSLPPVPEATARVARRAFRRGNPYLLLRDELGPIFDDRDFLSIYGHAGHPATSPALLALVTALQYIENLTDEGAAEAVRSRMDWKYLLGLSLEDEGFDASILSEFRTRLVAHDRATLLLDRLLAVLMERGILQARGRQRTDSTRVVMAVRSLNRLELVGETMRHALNTLAVEAPDWIRRQSEPAWPERYGPRLAASRLPQSQTKREALARQIGRDGMLLLAALDREETPAWLRELSAIRTLRRVWEQQYVSGDDGPRFRPTTALPPAAEVIRTPYDPDARWSVRRETEWTGYTVHLTETCDEQPHLITGVQTVAATTPDAVAIDAVQEDVARRDLQPAVQFLDSGYIHGPMLVQSQQAHGITIIGPVPPDSSWQGRAAVGYAAGDFQIDWEAEQATCPQGKRSSTWRRVTARGGRSAIQVHFRQADCGSCPVKHHCTRATRRSITLQERPEQEAIQAARRQQQAASFPTTYATRAGIEGTISQAVRRTGMRVSRYRGQAKTHLQHVATGLALNLIRLAHWYAGDPLATPHRSAYTSLMAAGT
jgi:transposase